MKIRNLIFSIKEKMMPVKRGLEAQELLMEKIRGGNL